MSIWVVALVLAVGAVLVTRGSFRSLVHMPLRAVWLVVVAAVLQVGLMFVTLPEARLDDVGFALLMLSYVALLAFCVVNFGLRGMGVVLVGVAMNTLVIGLNQGMPATEKVWRDGRVVEEPFERTVKHRPATDEDLLPFLSDIIVLPAPFSEAISFGDLVLAVGVIDVAFWGSRRRRRATADDDSEPPASRARSQRSAPPGEQDDADPPQPVFIDLTEATPEPRQLVEATHDLPPIVWEAPTPGGPDQVRATAMPRRSSRRSSANSTRPS